jgi:hypothetical protein
MRRSARISARTAGWSAVGWRFHFQKREGRKPEPGSGSGILGIAPFTRKPELRIRVRIPDKRTKDRHCPELPIKLCAKYRLRYLKSICGEDANRQRTHCLQSAGFRGGHLQPWPDFFCFAVRLPEPEEVTSKLRPGENSRHCHWQEDRRKAQPSSWFMAGRLQRFRLCHRDRRRVPRPA